MEAWNDLIVQVVSHLLEQAGTRMYDVYYLPRQPPPSTGVLLGLCDIIPPPVLLFVLCWGGVSLAPSSLAIGMVDASTLLAFTRVYHDLPGS